MVRYNEEKKENEICIIEIFSSLNGEGPLAGFPTVFVRTFGCNLRCKYNTVMNDKFDSILNGFCDTPECFSEEHFKEMYPEKELQWYTAKEIFTKVQELEKDFLHKSVCLTGGEPLLEVNKDFIINELLPFFVNPFNDENQYEVSIETNGSIDYGPYKNIYKKPIVQPSGHRTGVSFITDWKFPYSHMNLKMVEKNLDILESTDVIKIVISNDEEDWDYLENFLQKMKEHNCKAVVYLSPMYKNTDMERMWNYVAAHPQYDLRIQMQLHKAFFNDPNKKGV